MITQQKLFKILYDDGLSIEARHADIHYARSLNQRPGHVIINIEEVKNEVWGV